MKKLLIIPLLASCTNSAPIRVPYNPSYEKAVIADSTKHDWVKDESVCIKRRIIYDQMISE